MTRKRNKPIENPRGIGKISKEDTFLADVRNNIHVTQEFIISNDSEIPGIQKVTGSITIIEGERVLIDGSILTLQLDDGRLWRCFATQGDPISGKYSLSNSSSDGLVNG